MRWPPFQHIFFDCDSTLTAVEGIDVLAEAVGKKQEVERLTDAAMNGESDLEDVYAARLQAVQPTRGQVLAVRSQYKRHVVEDAADVLAALQLLGRDVYIISGGLYEPVREFGIALGVPADHIRAVNLRYDALAGDWWRHQGQSTSDRYESYRDSALTVSDGKADIVRELLGKGSKGGRSLLVGDGNSDLRASGSVDLFVGYGGVVKRPQVLAQAPAFIHSRSLAPLLPLALGPALLGQLTATTYAPLAEKSLALTSTGEVTFHHERLSQKFYQAYQAIFARPH